MYKSTCTKLTLTKVPTFISLKERIDTTISEISLNDSESESYTAKDDITNYITKEL